MRSLETGEVLSHENAPKGVTGPPKNSISPYKYVEKMVIMNDLDWSMLSYYVIFFL